MIGVLLILSAICLIIAGQIPSYDQTVNDDYCVAYSSPIFKTVIVIAKYSSILPVFSFLYYLGYGELSWLFKMLIWVVFYLLIKIIGTWLFVVIFGLGRGGAMRSIILLSIGFISLVLGLLV